MALTQVQGDMLTGPVVIGGVSLGAGNASAMKNRLINSAMVIDQRNAGASQSYSSGTSAYSVDRWGFDYSQTSKFTSQQNAGSVTPPVGFTNYLGVTSSSAYSITASDYFFTEQRIEGYNVADFGWGSASAKTVCLSFWVYSSLTGTFGGALRNSAGNRSYPFSYTISSANTWEQKSITVAGDTAGTWLTTNGIGIRVAFGLGVGSTGSNTAGAWAAGNYVSSTGATSVVGTSGATWYATGIQLEVGSSATGFEYRQYQQELALCQRYYYETSGGRQGVGWASSSTKARIATFFPVTMRTTPTSLTTTGTASNYLIYYKGLTATCTAVPAIDSSNRSMSDTSFTVASGLTAGECVGSNGSYLSWSAEL